MPIDGSLPRAAGDGRRRAGHDQAGRLAWSPSTAWAAATGARATAATAPTTSGCRTLKTKKITRLTDPDHKQFRTFTQDVYPMWGDDGQIYFSSERDGHLQHLADRADRRRSRRRSRAHGRRRAVPVDEPGRQGRSPTRTSSSSGRSTCRAARRRRVTIDLAFDPKDNLITWVEHAKRPDGFSPSPDGDYAAVDFHGEIFIVPTDGGGRREGAGHELARGASAARRSRRTAAGCAYRLGRDRRKRRSGCSIADRQHAEEADDARVVQGRSITWSPDSKRVAYVARQPAVRRRRGRQQLDRARLQPGRRLPGQRASRPTASGSSTPSATPIRTPTCSCSRSPRSTSTTSRRTR